MNETSKLLEVNDLVVEYTSGGAVIHAVNGVSLSLEKGKTLGLVGETGAGKTTIAKAILKILPNPQAAIKEGSVLLDGEDLIQKSNDEMLSVRGKRISMIFQDPMTALNPTMTIGSQIAEAIMVHQKMTKEEAHKKAAEMLTHVGITEERYNDFPFQFSGGMKQRVVIAMALACEPELLLADEPTTALDVTIQAQMLDLIANLKEEHNTAMILITHDLGIVAENCDNVAVIYAGQIMESGNKEDLFLHPCHPYTLGLFHSLPGWSVGARRLTPIEGMPPDPSNLPEGCVFSPRCPYATDACRTQRIESVEVSPGHMCRCINPREENRE